MKRIYLDYNSTSPADAEVISVANEAMKLCGNPSSVCEEGRKAKNIIENARKLLFELLDCKDQKLIFNSGATEGNNTVIRSFSGKHIAVSAIEHSSVLNPAKKYAGKLTIIPVNRSGEIDISFLQSLMQNKEEIPDLVSIMSANNETGVIQPLSQISQIVKDAGSLFHTDASQALGKIPFSCSSVNADFVTLSSHKAGGIQGSGLLICNEQLQTPVLIHGGGQEKNYRSGTENLPGIAAFGKAAELIRQSSLNDMSNKTRNLRDYMENTLLELRPDTTIFSKNTDRLPNTSMFSVPGLDSAIALMRLDLEGITISRGSACSSGNINESHVLKAMGIDSEISSSALRLSIGIHTNKEDINTFLEKIL